MLEDPMVPLPERGRVFRARRRVRLADAAPSSRARLDACARYLQDIGNDDTADSGIDEESGPWVVRRAVIDLIEPPRWGEWVNLATWCGGTGGRWAERRLSITGEGAGSGARVELDTLWIHLNGETLVPTKLPASFQDIYGEAAAGRKVSSKLWLGPPPDHADLVRRAWPLRHTDYDVMRHLNNAAYWEAVEELLAEQRHPLLERPLRAVLEYGSGIPQGADVELVADINDKQLDIWFTVDGTTHATARLIPLPT